MVERRYLDAFDPGREDLLVKLPKAEGRRGLCNEVLIGDLFREACRAAHGQVGGAVPRHFAVGREP